MKSRIFAITITLLMAFVLLSSCDKKVPETSSNVQKPSLVDFKEYFPYAEGTTLTFTSLNNSKKTEVKVKSTENNNVLISYGKDSKIQFNNEGLSIDGDFILKYPLENNKSWDTSKGKITIKNTDYVLSTPLGNFKSIEVSIEDETKTSIYLAKNFGIIKINRTVNNNTEETLLTKIQSSEIKTNEETKDNNLEAKVNKVYYYDGEKDTVVYKTVDKNLNSKDAIKYFEDTFKMPPKGLPKLMPSSTKINNIKVDEKNSTVTLDVSETFTESMNLGTSSETGILQGIANTLGTTYNCKKVIITVNEKDFVTGHIIIDKDNPLYPDMSNTKEL